MKRVLVFVLIFAFMFGAVGCKDAGRDEGSTAAVVTAEPTDTVEETGSAVEEVAETEVKSEAVLAAEKAIDAIGEVTLESEGLIMEAEKRYGFLTDAEKVTVANRMTLYDARNAYDTLVLKKQEAFEQRCSEIAAAFLADYDVSKAITSYRELLDDADGAQKEIVNEHIRILESSCFPGTHFLSYKALAVLKYKTSYGYIFELDGDAFVYHNDEKGFYYKSYYAKLDHYTEDPIYKTFRSFLISGEYYGYLSVNSYQDSTKTTVGATPYWDYLKTHFACQKITPDWGIMFGWEYSPENVYTDDLGNQLYTKEYCSGDVYDMYFLLKRAH